MGTRQNRLIEAIQKCTHNRCFRVKIRKNITIFHLKITIFTVVKNRSILYSRVIIRNLRGLKTRVAQPCLSLPGKTNITMNLRGLKTRVAQPCLSLPGKTNITMNLRGLKTRVAQPCLSLPGKTNIYPLKLKKKSLSHCIVAKL